MFESSPGADGRWREIAVYAVSRSMAFFDPTELDLSDWHHARPEIRRITDMGHGWESQLSINRIINHNHRVTNSSIPSDQQIHFETASQTLAIPDLALSAAVILLINRRIRGGFYPHPKLPPPGQDFRIYG